MAKPSVVDSPVLVVDALGFTNQIRHAKSEGLRDLAAKVEAQFHRFKAKVPHRAMLVSRSRVFATKEFNTLRLNDMFVLHAGKPIEDPHLRFLLSGSLLYHSMLLAGQIPRGGLGFGPIYRAGDLLIGNGFIDGYEAAEKRTARAKDICAVQLSPAFFAQLPNNRRTYQLLCFFEGYFYIHPWFLTDPEMGEFTAASILDHLERSGANARKLDATRRFLVGLEDYEAAKAPGSGTRKLREAAGIPWRPTDARNHATDSS